MRNNRTTRRMGLGSRVALGLTLVAGVGGAMQAFTASNTVTAPKAGDGTSTVSGYTISSVAYTLNATDPSKIDAVTFTTSAAATTVKARMVTTGSYYSCTSGDTTSWSCATTSPQLTTAAADEVRIVAVA